MKPIQLENKYGIFIGILILIVGIITSIDKLLQFFIKTFSDNNFFNWKSFLFVAVLIFFITWFIMNHFWSKEFKEHQITKFERDNYFNKLKIEEQERLVDIVTGVPNMKSLEQDLAEFFKEKRKAKELQFILIDLRNFRKINKDYGFMKTNKVLRMIAQNIYITMRRNEDMYKFPISDRKKTKFQDKFYRVHSGGDEFAFIIEGDQSDAIGFVNRLVPRFKEEFSSLTKDILGKKEKLSFYSAIVQVNHRDEYGDIIERAQDCYNLAKESDDDFALSWYPHDIEDRVPDKGWKKKNYSNAKNIFDVILNEI